MQINTIFRLLFGPPVYCLYLVLWSPLEFRKVFRLKINLGDHYSGAKEVCCCAQ